MIRYFAIALMPSLAGAVTLEMPANANLNVEVIEAATSYDLPLGPWSSTGIPTQAGSGELRQQAWRVDAQGLTTQQLIDPLREQLEDDGFRVVFSCQTEQCGGFDFRFGTSVVPAPDMHVDLGDFRFLSATRRTEAGEELVSVLASRSGQAGYVQITRIGAPQTEAPAQATAPSARAVRAEPTGDLAQELETLGRFILSDLEFETGSAQLGDGTFGTLDALADYLLSNPEITVALVGHTDSVGSLDGNIALSKRRAGSVLERLVSLYSIPRRQLEAEGMGYLAPVATNLTEDGREANRRVEVIMTSTE